MIIPVRCLSCGKVIGSAYEAFKKKVEMGEDPIEVLTDLGLKRYCCRAVFLTHVDVLKEVAKFRV